jgi:hypothetical protein
VATTLTAVYQGRVFGLGWDPDRALTSQAELLLSGRFCTVNPLAEIKQAYSLSQYSLRDMEQLRAGTCWVHAGVCVAETLAVALGYNAFPICRRHVGWLGKQYEGGGNPSNGGSVTDALRAMTSEKGAGIAHEDLCPYTDSPYVLGTKPPQAVFDDAAKSHLLMPVDVQSDDDARRLISNNHPVAIGTWWPFNFDDRQTFMTEIRSGRYGHALAKIGYVSKGVWPGEHGQYAWWQWRNWHGQLYPPLPPELAALVPGYKSDHPDTTSDFWVRADLDIHLQQKGNYEYVSATDLGGLDRKVVIGDFDLFPKAA